MEYSRDADHKNHKLFALADSKLLTPNSPDVEKAFTRDIRSSLADARNVLDDILAVDKDGRNMPNFEIRELSLTIDQFLELDKKFTDELDMTDDVGDIRQGVVREIELLLPLLLKNLIACRTSAFLKEFLHNYEAFKVDYQNLNSQAKKINGLYQKAEEQVDKIGLLPTKQQISNFSEMFGVESESFKNAAIWWLRGVFATIFAIIIVSVLHIISMTQGIVFVSTVSETIQLNISKVIILSTLFYCLAVCNRNYKSSKHNQILNKHRKNALASFQAFVDTPTADAVTKNAVLLEATRTIFAQQQTGYVVTDTDESPNQLIELLKSVQPRN